MTCLKETCHGGISFEHPEHTVKPVLSGHSKTDRDKGLKDKW